MGLLTVLTLSACAPAVTSTEPVGYQAAYDEVFDYVHYLMSVATPFEVASANRYSGSITAEYRVGAPGRTTSTWGVVAAIMSRRTSFAPQ